MIFSNHRNPKGKSRETCFENSKSRTCTTLLSSITPHTTNLVPITHLWDPSRVRKTPLLPCHTLSRSPLSTQRSFPLQIKRICRDSSFVTLIFMFFGVKLSLPARCFSNCFGSHGRTFACLCFCNRLRTAKPYVT